MRSTGSLPRALQRHVQLAQEEAAVSAFSQISW